MAKVTVQPLFLNDVIVGIGSSSFEDAVSSVAFTPSSSTVNFQGGTPDATFTFPTPSTWVCDLTYAQDFATEGSLALYLFNNEGETVEMTFTPKSGGPTVTATIVIVPGAIGGAIAAVATATVSLGCQGKPVITPAS